MNKRSGLRLAVAEVGAVGVNIVPVGLWLWGDYPAATAMLIYVLESAAAIVLAVLCVLLISPASDLYSTGKYKRRSKLIADFLTIAGGFLVICGLFPVLFVVLVLKVAVEPAAVLGGFAVVAIFQLIGFVVDAVTLRPMSLKRAEFYLSRSMGRTALLFFGVFLGVFLAGFVNEWFVVPFVVLKTITDVGEPIQFMLGKDG